MNLHAEAVECLRLADHDYAKLARLEGEEHPEGKAGFQLERLLDLLTERADEIAREAGDTFIDWQKVAPTDQWQRIVKNLAAVLRNPGSQP